MSTGVGSSANTSFHLRPLLRSDLQWSCRNFKRCTRWLARDPISLKFYWFGDREYRLMQLFQGLRTLSEIRSAWESRHALDPLDERELAQFVLRLESQGIIQFAGSVSAKRTEDRYRRIRRGRWFGTLASPLAVRFPLFDPTWLLDQFDFVRRLLFRPSVVLISLVVACLVGLLTFGVMSTQWVNRSLIEQFLAGSGIVFFAIAFVLLKSLHELGHAMACRHFGGECHEIGVMFLVMVPCLYCDVSDAWKLDSRFARVMISAAGILVELICAAIAAIVWMGTQPSPIHSVAFSMMLIGSLGTLFVNGNPLLRYDGYYILSDFVGIPNLAQQSQEALHSLLRRIFFRHQFQQTHWDASAVWLRIYGVASWLYRIMLLFVIFLSLYHWLDPLGLQWVLIPLSAGVVLSFYFRIRQISQFVQRESHDMRRFISTTALILLAVAAYVFFFVPLPARTRCRGIAMRTSREVVYAPIDAVLQTPLRADGVHRVSHVSSGESLLRLESNDLRLQQLRLSGDVKALEQRVKDLANRQVDDPNAAGELATATQSLAKLIPQLEELNARVDELEIHAPRTGVMLSGDREPLRRLSTRPGVTQTNSGVVQSGLGSRFGGAVFQRGTELATIASSDRWNAEVFVGESDIARVRVGSTTRVKLDRDLNTIVTGTVQAVAARPIERTPEQLRSDSGMQSIISEDGQRRPASPHYAVTIRIDPSEHCPSDGAVLSASIDSQPRILAQRCYDFVLQLMRSD